MSDSIPQEFQYKQEQDNYEYAESNQYTNRFVLSNLSWNQITAEDIYVLLNSFIPSYGQLSYVKIYITNQGKQQLKNEEEKGINLEPFYKQSVQYVLSQNPQYYKYYKKHIINQNNKQSTENKQDQFKDIVLKLSKEFPQIQQEIGQQQVYLYNQQIKQWYYLIAEFDQQKTCQTVANQVQSQFLNQDLIDCQILDDDIFQQMQMQPKFNEYISDGGYLKDQCLQMPTEYNFDNELGDDDAMARADKDIDYDKDGADKLKFFKDLSKGRGYDDVQRISKYFNLGDDEQEYYNEIRNANEEVEEYGEEEYEQNNQQLIGKNELEQMRQMLLQPQNQDDQDQSKSEEKDNQKIDIEFKSAFDDKLHVKSQQQTQFDKQLQTSKAQQWQYKISDKEVDKTVNKQLFNYYKKICKALENADDQQSIKMLQRKKQNIEKKYPDIKQVLGFESDSNKQQVNEQIDKERFDFD